MGLILLVWGCVNPDLLGDSDRPLDIENFEMEVGNFDSASSEIPTDTGDSEVPVDGYSPLQAAIIDSMLHVTHDVYLPPETSFDDIQVEFSEQTINIQYAPNTGSTLFFLSYDLNIETFSTGEYTLTAQEDSLTFEIE